MIIRSGAFSVFGQTFQNPVLLAAGTAGFGRELDGMMDLDRLGGIVTKAVSLAPRAGNRPPRVAEFPGGMLNSVGLANPGLESVRREDLPWLTARLTHARILINVVGFLESEYAEVIAGLDDLEAITGYEINLSCPNTSAGGVEFGADPGSVGRVIAACRRVTRRALIAKLSPALADVAAIAQAAVDAGADGISVVNTMPGYLFDGDLPRLGNGNGGVSGPALLPVGLLAVRKVKERMPDVPVIGVGGVRSARDVRQYLRAGASLVAIGTGQLADPHLPARIVRDLEENRGG
ncbi:MAG TPA: dihydroorotate dehydrogenase [Gemmatimonadales bacterium]|nr:dihydroorotate dehydrogenase [Gemmatimonadales bacterium]